MILMRRVYRSVCRCNRLVSVDVFAIVSSNRFSVRFRTCLMLFRSNCMWLLSVLNSVVRLGLLAVSLANRICNISVVLVDRGRVSKWSRNLLGSVRRSGVSKAPSILRRGPLKILYIGFRLMMWLRLRMMMWL